MQNEIRLKQYIITQEDDDTIQADDDTIHPQQVNRRYMDPR